ncbi:MAG: GNAT family N-acetyltransferase [Promethearchaeota archaeon]
MQVRKATASDKQSLLQLRTSLQEHVEESNDGIWKITEMGMQKLEQDVDQMLSNTEGLVLIAEKDRNIMGFAYGQVVQRADYTPKRVGFINMIFIQENHRRQGIGTKLVQRLCQLFKSKAAEHISLRYVVGNKEGQAFWEQLGFKPIIHTAKINLEQLEERLLK